jgi:hypothetical protein
MRGRTDDKKLKVIANFWAAAQETWPEAFASPQDYRIQATSGLYSLHRALPVIIQRCLDERDLTQESMARVLNQTGIDSQFWRKEGGDPLTLGTGMSSIRALAQYIVESLAVDTEEVVKL